MNVISTAITAVLAAILLSGFLKRPYLFVRNSILALLSSAVLVAKVPQLSLEAFEAVLTSQAFASTVVVGTAIAAATVMFGLFGIRFHGMLSMLFTGLPLYCALSVLGVHSALLISISSAVALAIVGLFFAEGYFAVERSVIGAALLTTALASIFGFSQSVCMVVVTAVAAAGSVAGIAIEASRSARERKKRADEQPAA